MSRRRVRLPSPAAAALASALPPVSGLLTGCGSGQLRLDQPWWLLALGLVAAAGWLLVRREPAGMAWSHGAATLRLPMTPRTVARAVPDTLRLLALALLVVAMARPQLQQLRDESVEGIDIMLALDMSGSMIAVDMSMVEIRRYQQQFNADPPNRFENAVATLKRFVDSRSRDRIGMVVFARDAYLQFPLTLDYATIQSLLDRLELMSIDPSATAIGNALGLAVRGLMDSEARSRTVILITDGKQQGGNISPQQAAELARDEGIAIYSILVGSSADTLVPTNPGGRGLSRYRPENYPIDPQLLQEIADRTGGAYYQAAEPQELEAGLNRILDDLETTRLRDVVSTRADELFAPISLAALLLLLLAGLLEHAWLRRFP